MKTLFLCAALALAATNITAKTLEINVENVRNDKGSILVMANIPGQDKPVYGMAPAKEGTVTVRLEGIDGNSAQVSLFHDEDGDYKMKMGERGPEEGYAASTCELPAVENRTSAELHYPAAKEKADSKK